MLLTVGSAADLLVATIASGGARLHTKNDILFIYLNDFNCSFILFFLGLRENKNVCNMCVVMVRFASSRGAKGGKVTRQNCNFHVFFFSFSVRGLRCLTEKCVRYEL